MTETVAYLIEGHGLLTEITSPFVNTNGRRALTPTGEDMVSLKPLPDGDHGSVRLETDWTYKRSTLRELAAECGVAITSIERIARESDHTGWNAAFDVKCDVDD